MKTLIFSDTHLTHRFERKKFRYLKRLIESVDEVIINGDFWDGLSTTFEKFVNSPWQELFPLLKQKNTVYIYGNHDFEHMADERVSLFSVKQVEKHVAHTNPKKLTIKHGHQHTPSIQNKIGNKTYLKFINRLYEYGEWFVLKLFGKGIFRHGLYGFFNYSLHTYAKLHLPETEILVCGHSHSAVFLPGEKYINSGFIRHGLAQYLIIENKKIRLIEEKY